MWRIHTVSLFFLVFGISLAGAEAGGASASWCQSRKVPVVSVKASTDQVSYNFTTSEKALNKFDVDTVNPYGKNIITDVGGLMKGGIETSQNMKFGTLTDTRTREVCYWYDTVSVLIHINPTVYVASEFPPGSCKHNAILEHEKKHVAVDREIVNEYAQLLGRALKAEIDARSVYGPVRSDQAAATERALKERMQSILLTFTRQMDQERKKRQQVVDSLSEYERVNHLCPEDRNRKQR